ncbi:hypothetical protein, partial [Thermococcus sp.]|uniref:hypothetical protein n=1 Tax=Thermococcus sp. TaxID=35749 RepID=UPI002632DDEB
MVPVRDKVLAGIFIFQALFNMFGMGFPGFIIGDSFIPRPFYGKLAWTGPYLVVVYFLLGIASIFYLTAPGKAGRGRALGYAYFTVGALGSLMGAGILGLGSGRPEWFIIAFLLTWTLSSILGFLVIRKVEGLELWLSALAV